ncbi:MAG: crossover junction endodeoxyribonuclease RuvC [Patescibacteria group bacterium]
MKIISIDPGYERIGIAILEKENSSAKETLLYSDCFQTSSKDDFEKRLWQIGQEISKIIKKYRPTVLAIESLYFNTNQKTALLVSETKGAVKYIALEKKLKIFEYTPLQIKIAVTGYGRSSKNQIISMTKNLISINKKIKYDDEYDAVAIGLTYFACNPVRGK